MSSRHHPTNGSVVTSAFRTKSRPNHDGTDYRAATGTPIHAAQDGVVDSVLHNHATAGNYVQLRHASDGGALTTYSHLSAIHVSKGQTVKAGDVIGLAGATGNAKGAHLHFGVKINGAWVNPATWLKGKPAATGAPTKKPSESGPLIIGSTGPRVKELQRVLNAWYPSVKPALVVDGIYGPKTARRVRYFQQRAGLVVDGIAGPITLGALNIH